MSDKDWDVFISHASEDKATVAKPLTEKLIKLGLKVWLDEFELKIGDSLSRSIDLGLSNSKFGIVILSENFFKKDWTEYEYRGLVAKSIGRDKTILPIWHNITREAVLKFSPTLADTLAENTMKPIDQLAINLINVINPQLHSAVIRKLAHEVSSLNSQPAMIDPRVLKKAPIRHDRLPAELIRRISMIRSAMNDVYPISMEEWVEGFQRDAHPSREIRVWEFIASNYLQIKSVVDLSNSEKREVFGSLLANSTGDHEEAVEILQKLPPDKEKKVIEAIVNESKTVFEKKSEREQDAPDLDYENFSGKEAKIDNIYIEELAKLAQKKAI